MVLLSANGLTNYFPLNIGLLIPGKDALEAKRGAELAISEANRQGGYGGHPFHLIVQSTEGLWGVGAKRSVSLVFEDSVLAILGSLDGRNAHLAEQVTTKTKVAFMSSQATDMTLSYAFVPWYFRCIPDDKQQATTLIEEIYKKRRLENVLLVGMDTYDSKHAIATFLKVTGSMNLSKPKQFLCGSTARDFEKILLENKTKSIDAFVLFGDPAFAADFMSFYRQYHMKQPVFGTLSLLGDQKAQFHNWHYLDNVVLVSSGQWFTKKGIGFQKKFQEKYGYPPSPVAAYAYDGIHVIIEAVKKAGPDRDKVIEALSTIRYFGSTGEIRFDEKGNRAGKARLMLVKNGVPSFFRTKQ